MKRLFTLLVLVLFANTAFSQEVKINYTGTSPNGNGLVVEADGTLRVDGTATTWDDLRVPLSEPSTGKIKPDWGEFPYGETGSAPFLNWFKASGVDEMYFLVQLPHSWKEGTDIMPHIHWVPSENGTALENTVQWKLQYTWMNIGETHSAYSNLTGNITEPPDNPLVKSRQYLTPLGTISGSGKTISSMLVCRIYRDGDDATNDKFKGLAGALEIDFHYQINTLGSRTEYAK